MAIHTEVADWLTYSANVAAAVALLHAEAPLDVVDFPEWAAEGYIHLLNRTEWNRTPTVIHLHGPLVMFAHTMGWPEIDSEFYRTGTVLEGTCLRLADAVFSSSRCSADWGAKHYGLDRERIPVLHTGVDTKLFAPGKASKANRPTIVFAGKLAQNKGVFLLLEAACRLAKEIPDLQLRLIGWGEPKVIEDLRRLAQGAGVPDVLDLAGFVPREEMPDHLCRAHVFAAPSVYEGGPGFVYLEAMACGLPTIGCAGSGAAEVVEGNGVLVPPNDLPALVQALREVLLDPKSAQAISARARRYVVEQADSQVCLKRLEAFYQSVVSSAKG
jgi:glycosyltransferase involved in cell wall biosynthesis